MQSVAEALIDQLIGGQHLACEVARQEERCNDDATDHVAEDDLQEAEVSGEGDAWYGDDGERRGLSGDDRERYGPPGNGVVGEKVGLERLVDFFATAFGEAQAEEGDADQVERDDDEVDGMEVRGH